MGDIFSKEKRSQIMSLVKNKDTNIELLVRKGLSKRGFRYRVKSNLFGKPDIVFKSKKVVIFCDGDFWHGKNFKKEKGRYTSFWVRKIQNNIDRDKIVTQTLTKLGWKVLRFWKSDILKHLDKCILRIEKELKKQDK